MSAINNIARDLWYSTGRRDRHLSKQISAEVFRYEQIEKAGQAIIDNKNKLGELSPDGKELLKALQKSLKMDTRT